MARKASRQARAPRRPRAPSGAVGPGAGQGSRAQRGAARGAKAPAAAQAIVTSNANLSETYAHVRRDLRRIAVLAVVMFGLIFGSTVLAGILGPNFMLDAIR